jgi:hypothetical protein
MISGRTQAHELEQFLVQAWKAERVAAAANAGTPIAIKNPAPRGGVFWRR